MTLRKKGHPAKIGMARRLRAETTVTLQWIAARLRMGTKGHLSHLLYWHLRAQSEQSTPADAKRAVKSGRPGSRRPKSTAQLLSRPNIPNEPKGQSANRNRQALVQAKVPTVLKGEKNALPLTDPSAFDPTFD